MKIPENHPRYHSLKIREQLVMGYHQGITSMHGLIAHGRGETFDYLIGETTRIWAKDAINAACAMLLLAEHPVLSVNGNTAALVGKDVATLSNLIGAPVEVNLFHRNEGRVKKIVDYMQEMGAKKVLQGGSREVPGLDSERRWVDENGIWKADVVLVPLEDGDRCEKLQAMGKRVITVDLNPLSRTARSATITIVDNVVRTMPMLCKCIDEMQNKDRSVLEGIVERYSNNTVLSRALIGIKEGLTAMAEGDYGLEEYQHK
ncbi:MAG: 4-phosphopantoate--beta-alanine ligase [Methermicoccaceae archaeon]